MENNETSTPPAGAKVKPLLATVLLRTARSLAFIFGCVALFLFFYQTRMMYFPRGYDREDFIGWPDDGVELTFQTSQGRQVAFYRPPSKDEGGPIWVCFAGNASTALDWRWFAKDFPDKSAGFLLVDLPGYGRCEGKPSPSAALESSVGALAALAAHLETDVVALEPRLNVLGHSMGAAVGAQFAVAHPPRRLVMISPYTSMMDMARRRVGWPMAEVLTHRYNNVHRLEELAAMSNPPRVTILHGTADSVIPYAMGESLAASQPGLVTLVPLQGGDHDVLSYFGRQVRQAMTD